MAQPQGKSSPHTTNSLKFPIKVIEEWKCKNAWHNFVQPYDSPGRADTRGFLLRSYYSGPLGDKFVLWKARRNGGIREPEHRLWLYILPLLMAPSGLILWGVGAAHNVHWFGLVVAMYMLGTCIAVGCQLPIAYCIDSYSDFGADGIVTVIIVRNTMSFAIGYG